MRQKFVNKYMRLARLIGIDTNPCFSRNIGAVIVDPHTNSIRGTGYNGPPPGTPHTDTYEYLSEYFWPQLTPENIDAINTKLSHPHSKSDFTAARNEEIKKDFLKQFVGKRMCPRRLIDAGPGQRNELCSCGHAERHAITNAHCDVTGFYMFCWCGVPCAQCADAIVQAGISRVYCLQAKLYHELSPWILSRGSVIVETIREADALEGWTIAPAPNGP